MKTLLLLNWRTTLAGSGMILGALADVMLQLAHGDWDQTRLGTDAFAVVTGLGLIGAKDATVAK